MAVTNEPRRDRLGSHCSFDVSVSLSYTDPVFSRCSRLLRAASIVMLTLTAADLANPQCCAEEIRAASTAANSASVSQTTENPPTASFPDDCLCCARCIDTGLRFTAIILDLHNPVTAPAIDSVNLLPHSFDRPPQLA